MVKHKLHILNKEKRQKIEGHGFWQVIFWWFLQDVWWWPFIPECLGVAVDDSQIGLTTWNHQRLQFHGMLLHDLPRCIVIHPLIKIYLSVGQPGYGGYWEDNNLQSKSFQSTLSFCMIDQYWYFVYKYLSAKWTYFTGVKYRVHK